jgi:hypothetical protein
MVPKINPNNALRIPSAAMAGEAPWAPLTLGLREEKIPATLPV